MQARTAFRRYFTLRHALLRTPAAAASDVAGTQRWASSSSSVDGDPYAADDLKLPQNRQVAPNVIYNWKEAHEMQGLPHIKKLMPADTPTPEHLEKVAAWQPVVRVTPDTRFRVAIVGCVNTGKSTLFNSLVSKQVGLYGRRPQMNADLEGLTRDAVDAVAELDDMVFTVVDTPGVYKGSIVEEAKRSLHSADLIVMVVAADASAISADEYALARMLNQHKVPSVLVINKMDAVMETEIPTIVRSYMALGLGRGVVMSAPSRITGFDSLADVLRPFYNRSVEDRIRSDWATEDLAAQGDEDALEEVRTRNNTDTHIRIAIVGRPNAGKSSLINRLVGFDRSRVAEEANTTRDAIEIGGTYRGRKVRLIDTAGMMRAKSRKKEEFLHELYNVSKRAMNFAHVVIVCFDATEGYPNPFDMALCHMAVDEGRPFVLCATKWDAVLDHMATAEAIDYRLKKQINEVRYAQAVVTSAESGANLTLLMDQALTVYDTWNRRLRSAELNRFWKRMEKSLTIPHHVSRIMRITQVNVRPPTFKVQLQTRSEYHLLPPMWESMLRHSIAEEFDLSGVPIRFIQNTRERHPDMI